MKTLDFRSLLQLLREKTGGTYMIIGNGSKNQFRYITQLKESLKQYLSTVPKNSAFLYFGDAPNAKKPDIGYAFELLHKLRPDITIVMIQIDEAKSWGTPSFVSAVYWHHDYTKACKWGGLDAKGFPCSNTKKWVAVAARTGITNILVLGGGEITLDEVSIAKHLHIPYTYVPLERRFKGNGKTRIKDSDSKRERIGITFNAL